MTGPDLHPDVAHLGFLLGTWRGEGAGEYPTIEPFTFIEETVFGHVGKGFITFSQRTRGSDGLPLHAENGWIRPVGTDRVEFLVTSPAGICESLEGAVTGTALDLTSAAVLITGTAKHVGATARTYTVNTAGDEMQWTCAMEAVGQPMGHHLRATLRRS